MTTPDEEDPRARIEAGLNHARDLQRQADESKRRAARLRKMRVDNGFHLLLADVLGGTA